MGIKEGVRRLLLFVAAMVLAFGFWQPASAELLAHGLQDEFEQDVEVEGFGFPLWYMDANRLKLQACLDEAEGNGEEAEVDFCLKDIQIVLDDEDEINEILEFEFLYWLAEAEMRHEEGFRARIVMALEGVVDDDEGDAAPFPAVFNEIVLRFRGLQPGALYTITHPFGEEVAMALDNGRIRLNIPVDHPEENFFDAALVPPSPIQHFLYWDRNLPQPNADGPDFYIGDPLFEEEIGEDDVEGHRVFGSPFGTNYLRIAGPGLPDGAEFVQIDRFAVVGKVFFNEGQNLAPWAQTDFAGLKPGETVLIDVLANDLMQGDVPINPTSLEYADAITIAVGQGTASAERIDGTDKIKLQYTAPAEGFGKYTFDYTIQTFTGMDDTAAVVVFVEDMEISQAEYRARTGKWTIAGSGNLVDLSHTVNGETAYYTRLTGAQEVPPVTTSGSGEAIITLRSENGTDFIDYTLTYEGLIGVTQAHIHNGGVGVNGPVNVFLCTNLDLPENFPLTAQEPPACPTEGGTVTGTLSEDDFISAGDVTTFSALLEAIDDGNTYVNVHTAAFGPGELRGQIGVNVISLRMGEEGAGPAIGVAEVSPEGLWNFSGKSIGSPGEAGEMGHVIHAESAAGATQTHNLQLR